MSVTAFNGRTPKAAYIYNFTAGDYSGTVEKKIDRGLYYCLCAGKRSEKGGWPRVDISIKGDATIIDKTDDGGIEYVSRTRIVKVSSGTATVKFSCVGADRVSNTFQIVQIK